MWVNHPDGVAIHDLNGDGKNDIVVSNFDDNNIMIFLKNNIANFSEPGPLIKMGY